MAGQGSTAAPRGLARRRQVSGGQYVASTRICHPWRVASDAMEMVKVGDDVVRPGHKVRTPAGDKTVYRVGQTDDGESWVYVFMDGKEPMIVSSCDSVSITRSG